MNQVLNKYQRADELWKLGDHVLLNTEEAAFLLDRSPQTLKKWRAENSGPQYMRGRPVNYTLGAIKDYVAMQQSGA